MVFTAAAQQKEEDDYKLVFDSAIVSTQQIVGDEVKNTLWVSQKLTHHQTSFHEQEV